MTHTSQEHAPLANERLGADTSKEVSQVWPLLSFWLLEPLTGGL